MKRKLKVDLNELAIALSFSITGSGHYLDLQTGRVLSVGNTEWAPQELLQPRGGIYGSKTGALLDAARVAFDGQERYLAIEPRDPYQDYLDMAGFAATVDHERLHEQLERALCGLGACCCFNELVARHPDLQKQWYAYKDARAERRLLCWLDDHDIQPIM